MTKPMTARHDLTIWRNDDYYEYPIRVVGLDLTDTALTMEIRRGGDVSGPPEIALAKITNGENGATFETQGLHVRGVTVVDAVEVSDVRIRMDRPTLQALPYDGERGDAATFEYALVIGGRTRIRGNVILPAHAYRSDAAPAARQPSYSSSYVRQAGAPDSGASLTISKDGGATLLVDGADMVSASIVRAEAARDDAEGFAAESAVALNNLGQDAFSYVGRPSDAVLVNGTPTGIGSVFWHHAIDVSGNLTAVDVFDRAAGTINVAVYRGPLNALVRVGLGSFITTGVGTSRRIALAAPLAVRAGDLLAIQGTAGVLTVAEVQSGDVGYTYSGPFLPETVSLGAPTTNGQVQVRFVITYRDQIVTADSFLSLSEVRIVGARAVALTSGARPRVQVDAKLYGDRPDKLEISWRGYSVTVNALPFTIPDQSAVKDFAVSGNSIDDATDTPKWHTLLAERLGVTSRFTARYSSDGRQTFRAGIDELLFTFANDTVPAGGNAKAIAAINGNSPIDPKASYAFLNTGDANLATGVTLAGILIDLDTGESRHGIASIPNAASAAYSFTQDAGLPAITLSGPALFLPDIAKEFARCDNFCGIGNNLFYSGVPGVYGDFTNASLYPVIDKFAAAAQGNRFMTRDVLPAGEWPADGSPNVIDGVDYKTHMFAALEAWNARNEARHPGSRPRSLPTSGFPNGRTALRYLQDHGNGSAPDNAAIAQGKIPISLWSDGPHPNAAGQIVLADFCQEAMQAQSLSPAAPAGTTVTITASSTNPRTGEIVRTVAYAVVEGGDLAELRDSLNGIASNSEYFDTLAEAVENLPVDKYFISRDVAGQNADYPAGIKRQYRRVNIAPYWVDKGPFATADDVGLDPTRDADKPVSNPQAVAIAGALDEARRPFRTRAALAASTNTNISATLAEAGYEGVFTWVTGNFSALIAADPSNFIASTVPGAPAGAWARLPDRKGNRIYAVAHGVKDSTTIDSADVLQQLVNYYSGYKIEVPDNMALSHKITYSDGCHIVGRNKDKANIYLLPGFVGTAAFEPRARISDTDWILRCKFHDFLVIDKSAVNANRGSTSVLNGVDITGTFDCEIFGVKGVRINAVVRATPGPAGKLQWTKRVRMSRLDWGNVNYGFKFEPALDDRFPYGDVQITNTEAVGSCARGCWIEDTDGFQCTSSVAFSNGQLRMSGNALSVAAAHSFFAVAALTDESNFTADGIFVSARAGNGRSTGVSITGGIAFQTARLSDEIKTIENPPARTNKGGIAIRLQSVDGFNIHGMALDTSQQSMTATGCTDGIISLTSLRANTQVLGSGALPVGTFDAVTLTNCQGVAITLADQSASKRYAVYADDTCKGISVSGVATLGGTNVPSQIRLPSDASSYYSVLSGKADGSYVLYASHVPLVPEQQLTVGSTMPLGFYGRNGARGVLNNPTSVHIIDLPDILDGCEGFVRILDNGGSKLDDITQNAASKMKFKDGQTKLGRGYCVRLFREPYTHMLIEI